MALSGLAMVGFLIGHIGGNLLIFLGKDALNGYAESLREFPLLLNMARVGLVAMVALHIYSAAKLTHRNKAANPIGYRVHHANNASLASRSMGLTGMTILVFILYHLAHFTWRFTHPEFEQLGPFDAYTMIVASFKSLPLAALYVAAIALVCLHLSHAIKSAIHTLGLSHTKYTPAFEILGKAVSALLFFGFSSIPVAVVLGYLG